MQDKAEPRYDRVLVTGARGFLSSRLCAAGDYLAAPSLRGMEEDQLRRVIDETRPDAIIHTAALSSTAECERDEAASWEANVALPLRLARAARGIEMVLLSSDQVYNGCAGEGPFDEEARLRPTNVYGRHKLEMERRVLEAMPEAVLLRATWLFDLPLFGTANRGNFLVNLLLDAARQAPIRYSREQYRGLSYAREAAHHLCAALDLPGGVYNFGSETDLNMVDTARAALDLLGSPAPVLEAPPRPSLWMDCGKLRAAGIRFASTLDAIRQCLEDYQLLPEAAAAKGK